MASAVCPACNILLIEANDNQFSDLGASVNTAVASGADVVSNSYYGSEFAASDPDFIHPGHVIVAASGDDGFGAYQPASFSSVVAVGGTSLYKSSNKRGWLEWTWSGTGSGCSALVAKPAWQHDSGCSTRTLDDVAAIADPDTGVAVRDTFGLGGNWFVYGGTSVGTPIIASLYALAGKASTQEAAKGLWLNKGANLNDITRLANGTCSPKYLCTAGVGYDGPTGWGTPSGLEAFQ